MGKIFGSFKKPARLAPADFNSLRCSWSDKSVIQYRSKGFEFCGFQKLWANEKALGTIQRRTYYFIMKLKAHF
jgi:hypothetical protein